MMFKRIKSALPITEWLPAYQRGWLRPDIMAGLAVWAMTVPQVLAYAGIAGVPPVYGLYAIPLAMTAYAVFGTSRTLSVGPEAAIAIISAVTVGALVVGDAGEFLVLTALLTFIVGLLFLVFGLLRLGWVANFLSQPVLQGLTQGIALTVIIGQIPILFGTEAGFALKVTELSELWHTGFFLNGWAVLSTLGSTELVTMIVGLGSLVLLFAFKRVLPKAPSALIAVILGVLAVYFLGLAERGVDVIGEVQTGIVSLSVPSISLARIAALLPGAFAILLVGYSISLSVAAVSAQATGEEINPNQELIGLGVANIGSALSSGFVVCGSLSRGVVIRRAGGRTQVVSLVNAALVFITLILLLPLFFKLPDAVLSAIVIQAMSGLLSFTYFRNLFRINRGEFAYAMAALFGVLILGILQGVTLGVILSLIVLIRHVSRPNIAVLGRMPGTSDYRDTSVYTEAETIPGLLIFRFDAPIIFVNARVFADAVRRLIKEAAAPVSEILIAAQQINELDSTGADQMMKLNDELAKKGIAISIAEPKHALLEAMRTTGLKEKIDADRFYESIEDGVQAFLLNR